MSWDAIYARLACATGWTWEYIDRHVTLPMLLGFGEYWHESPPVNELVAAWLGGKQSGTEPAAEDAPDLLSIIPRRG